MAAASDKYKLMKDMLFDDFLSTASLEDLLDVPVFILKFVAKLTPEDQAEFNFKRIFAKNIILFGGINNYVNNFFAKGTIEKFLAMPSGDTSSLVKFLKEMDTYEDLSEENRARISSALERILPRGGARRHRSRRQRRRAITRRRR
jgi:hypothetical protein